MAQTIRRTMSRPMLRDSVEQVWLAGLGALALTEEEGSRFFRSLVKRGEGFERRTKARLVKAMAAAREAPGSAMTRVEVGFDGAMSGALHRLGVPTQREITNLTRRVEGLASALERRPSPSRRSAGTRATPTARPRRKTAADRTSVSAPA